jgi:hypothetical protein
MVPVAIDLAGAEENGLMVELSRRGRIMHYDPNMVVYHERRPTPQGFTRQMLKYGRGRGQLMRRSPRTVRCAYLAPVALVLYLALLPLLTVWNRVSGLALLLYAVVLAMSAARVGVNARRVRFVPLAAALIVVVHVCYGIGVVWGVLGRRRPRPQPEWADAPAEDAEKPSLEGV